MTTIIEQPHWWSSASIRLCHPQLNPDEISAMLNTVPEFSQKPGESKIPHGDCKSAGYWCITHRVDYPSRPNVPLSWAEDFIRACEPQFSQFLKSGYDINIYVGIHTNVLALGFNLPIMTTIDKLSIPVGIEFFSR